MLVQNFAGTNEEHYGMLWYFLVSGVVNFNLVPGSFLFAIKAWEWETNQQKWLSLTKD